jgi:hypothetical protein
MAGTQPGLMHWLRAGVVVAFAIAAAACTAGLTPPTVAATTPLPLNNGKADPLAPGPTPAGTSTSAAKAAPKATPTTKVVKAAPTTKTAAKPPPTESTSKAVAATPEPPPLPTAAPAGGTEAIPLTAPAGGATPAAATGPATDAQGFPLIGLPPAQPTGTLLPPEERKRIIGELEALRAKQGKPPASGGAAADLSQEGATHGAAAIKQIEECANDSTDPDCLPPATQ